MSILNVNQIQPVGSGQTVTISATNIDTGSATVTAGTFTGNLTGNVTGGVTVTSGNLTGITSVSTTNLTVNGNAYPSSGPLSNRNLIINGAMQVWQRGTTFASDTVGGGRYTADRWNVPNRTRAARSTDAPSGFTYSLLIDREQTGGVEPFTVSTGIEVQDITQTGSYTLSFYAKSADITTLNINVQDRTLVREGGTNNSSIVTDEAITIDNTWTRYTHTFTISSVSFTGTSLRISIGNTSSAQDDEALITGVQLEVGSVATPFEHRSFGDELVRCKRYYEKSYPQGTAPGSVYETAGTDYMSRAGLYRTFEPFSVEKRGTPSVVIYSPNTGAADKIHNVSSGVDATAVTDTHSPVGARIGCNSGGDGDLLRWHWTADAEL